MAVQGMSWIRTDVDAEGHTKVRDFCDAIKDRDGFIYVWRLWSWAGKRFPLGMVPGATRVEEAINWRGKDGLAVDAFVSAGLLEPMEQGFAVHGWEEHNGAAFKKMERDRERLRLGRKAAAERDGRNIIEVPSQLSHASVARQVGDSPSSVAGYSIVQDDTGQNSTKNKEEDPPSSTGDKSPETDPFLSCDAAGSVQRDLLTVEPKPSPKESLRERQITEVLEDWRAHMGTPGAVIEGPAAKKRRKIIGQWLTAGVPAEKLKRVNVGATKDGWLMGTDPGAKPGGWRGVETLFKSLDQIERLAGLVDVASFLANGSADHDPFATLVPPSESTDPEMIARVKAYREEQEAKARARQGIEANP